MSKKQKIVILLWMFLLIVSWLLLFSPTIQNNFTSLMNMLCFYFPVCIVFTICFAVYLVAVTWSVKRNKEAILPKGLKRFFTIIVILCLLFVFIFPRVFCFSTAEKEHSFQQFMSLKNLIGENYNEDNLYAIQKKNWGDTFYIHGIVLVNEEKLICVDQEIRDQYSNPAINYNIQYFQNIPSVLRNHMSAWLHDYMKIFVQNCAFADTSQIKSFEYESIQFQVYYDKYREFKTERLILCAECGDDMLLFSLILEDESNQLSINQDHIIEQITELIQFRMPY